METARKAFAAFLICLLRAYKLAVSPWLGPRCRFEPSCSQYLIEAISVHGVVTGVCLGVKRLARCHPWGGAGVDPVPESTAKPVQINQIG